MLITLNPFANFSFLVADRTLKIGFNILSKSELILLNQILDVVTQLMVVEY